MNGQDIGRALARFNHILIPATRQGRDRARSTLPVRLARPVVWIYTALSDSGRGLALLLILLGGLSVDLSTSQGYWLWSLATGVLLASVLLRPAYRLRGVDLRVVAPRQVTLGEAMQFELQLHNAGKRDLGVLHFDRPLLTWDGRWLDPPPMLSALPAGATRSLRSRARFVQRGHHHLDRFWVAALLPGGLAQGVRIRSGGIHFVVVPPIARVRRLRLPQGSRYQQGGVALASSTGESMELMGVRPYRPGDAVRDLHARSWARRGQPVVREFHQEYFSRVGVVLDTAAGRGGEARLEAGISLAAGVIAHLTRGESLIDVLVTGGSLHALTLGRSLGFLEQALDHLACVRAGPELEPAQCLGLLGPYLERLSCVILIALSGDAPRLALARAIEVQGAGCRRLQVTDARQAAVGHGFDAVPVAAIQAGEDLLL